MHLMLLAALAAASPAESDLRCYRLMAELARADAPSARNLGIRAANWFLGRIDARAPGFDVSRLAAIAETERPALLRQCMETLDRGGFGSAGGGERGPATS